MRRLARTLACALPGLLRRLCLRVICAQSGRGSLRIQLQVEPLVPAAPAGCEGSSGEARRAALPRCLELLAWLSRWLAPLCSTTTVTATPAAINPTGPLLGWAAGCSPLVLALPLLGDLAHATQPRRQWELLQAAAKPAVRGSGQPKHACMMLLPLKKTAGLGKQPQTDLSSDRPARVVAPGGACWSSLPTLEAILTVQCGWPAQPGPAPPQPARRR